MRKQIFTGMVNCGELLQTLLNKWLLLKFVGSHGFSFYSNSTTNKEYIENHLVIDIPKYYDDFNKRKVNILIK